MARRISRSGRAGNGLVDSLLGLAQSALQSESQAPRQVDSMPPLDLAAAVERRLPLLRQMAGNKIELEIKTAGDGGPTALREPEFERILLNLVRNAIEAMENGGRLRIVLEHGHGDSGHSILLRVSDTGSGIAAELLPHIFNSGVSTKLAASEDPQSRGFGLAIVRELALRAGGSVRVRSKPRQGSTFTVELPLVEESLSDRSPAKSQMPVSSVRPHRLAVVPEKPKSKTNPGVHFNNCGANRRTEYHANNDPYVYPYLPNPSCGASQHDACAGSGRRYCDPRCSLGHCTQLWLRCVECREIRLPPGRP